MEPKACESTNEDLLPSGITSNGGSSSPFFVSSIRGTIIENTSSTGTLTQMPFFPKYEVELDSHRKVIPYPGKEHIERVLEEYSHQVKDLQKRLNESNELHEKQKFYLRQSVIDLQTKLQEMQMERDAMADIRIEQLISEHEVEITGLTEKASSARSQANSIQSQLEIIQEQARNQNSMYMRQLSDLESTVSQLRSELREAKRMYEDKENLQNSPLRIWSSRSCHYWLCRFGFTLNFRFLTTKIYHDLDSKFIFFLKVAGSGLSSPL